MKKSIVFLFLFVFGCSHTPNQPETRLPSGTRNTFIVAEDEDSEVEVASNPPEPLKMVGLYNNPLRSPVAQFLRLAKKSIDIEIYEMADPEVREVLREKLGNVPIRIVKEPKPIGQSCDPWGRGMKSKRASAAAIADCEDQQLLVQQIRGAPGGAFEPFNKDQLCGKERKKGLCFEHGKMIVIDRQAVLLSTGNFNSSNLCNRASNPKTCNRDYSYISRDPLVVKTLLEIFENDLKGTRYNLKEILDRPGVSQKITVSPYSFDPLAALLRRAKGRIQIQNQYINMNTGLADLLIERASKGVDIEVQVSDVCAFGKVSDKKAYELSLMFSALEDSGVKVRMFNKSHQIGGRAGYLHAKAIVIDGGQETEEAWVGSVNGSTTSLNENREYGIFYSQPSRVRTLSRYLADDFADSTSQTWRDSLRCRNIGYQSAEAAQKDDRGYEEFMLRISGSTGPEKPNEDAGDE